VDASLAITYPSISYRDDPRGSRDDRQWRNPMQTNPRPRAVVFDFGGVLITPITEKVTLLAEAHGTSTAHLLEVLLGPRDSGDHPWHRCERGEIALADIQGLLGPWATAGGLTLDGDEIESLMQPTYRMVEAMLTRVTDLRNAGYRTALLTNTFAEFRATMESQINFDRFDVVIESFAIGARKPDRAIYEATAAALGVEHHEIVYLDDFDQNLEPAVALGWSVIHVTDPAQALAELDQLAPM
jgi:putative hydrolase of the HAD superfamily